MHDGTYLDGVLAEATGLVSAPFPYSKLAVMLPVMHDGDEAVFTWSIREGENAQFSRHPSPVVRAKFACALALRASESLSEIADETEADIEFLGEQV